MKPPTRTEFLDRDSYRQRRFRDAARWLPILAAVLMLLPLMWPRDTPDQSLTSSGIIYLFGLWVFLVALAFLLSRVLRFSEALDGDGGRSGRSGE
ncbi:hypothetical protein [Octadecabacter antarcticus]|uniref:hypothetical protein n=1 Tax=Octadecabacter antarcticus TaxID=1217908 RepID=UPI0001806BFB|nr:hypothetical protein [Octadecabacter antarcticus]